MMPSPYSPPITVAVSSSCIRPVAMRSSQARTAASGAARDGGSREVTRGRLLVGRHVAELQVQVAGVGRKQRGRGARDRPLAHEPFELAIEVLHPFERAVLHRI